MRNKIAGKNRAKILVCDDDQGVIDSLKKVLEREGFSVEGVTRSTECIHEVQQGNYDILILDYLIDGLNGEQVATIIRKFSHIWIILLTGHKDLAPPLESLRNLNIQGYCEKSSRFDKILLQVEIGMKAIHYLRTSLLHFRFQDIFIMLREDSGYTQDDVARLIEVNRGTIIDYENGRSIPTTAILVKLSDLFGVSIDVLLGRIIHK